MARGAALGRVALGVMESGPGFAGTVACTMEMDECAETKAVGVAGGMLLHAVVGYVVGRLHSPLAE